MSLRYFSDDQVDKIHENALEILESHGFRVEHRGALEMLEGHGALVDFESNMVRVKPDLVGAIRAVRR